MITWSLDATISGKRHQDVGYKPGKKWFSKAIQSIQEDVVCNERDGSIKCRANLWILHRVRDWRRTAIDQVEWMETTPTCNRGHSGLGLTGTAKGMVIGHSTGSIPYEILCLPCHSALSLQPLNAIENENKHMNSQRPKKTHSCLLQSCESAIGNKRQIKRIIGGTCAQYR